MDDNKLEKLREIDYTIHKCCGLCDHGEFKGTNWWGTCKLHDYDHKKHEGGGKGSNRELSITIFGYCDEYQQGVSAMISIAHYKEFYE